MPAVESMSRSARASFDELPDSALVSIKQTAEILQCSDDTVRRYCDKGILPKLRKVGPNMTRLQVGELRAALAAMA